MSMMLRKALTFLGRLAQPSNNTHIKYERNSMRYDIELIRSSGVVSCWCTGYGMQTLFEHCPMAETKHPSGLRNLRLKPIRWNLLNVGGIQRVKGIAYMYKSLYVKNGTVHVASTVQIALFRLYVLSIRPPSCC